MEFQREREAVVAAGRKLVETGLIARTWGNVSCRVDGGMFVITPSGRPYESLKPEDIVPVTIDGCKYSGDVKPSSEKGVHAEVYALKPGAMFVIHTHQPNASVAAALGRDVAVGNAALAALGGDVPLAVYGLPGTKKLRRGVSDALKRTEGRALLMARHGALCWGADEDQAFAAALALEKECAGLGVFEAAANEADLPLDDISQEIRRVRPELSSVRICTLPAVVEASRSGSAVMPYLDDFAQLIGHSARCVRWDASDAGASAHAAARALKGRNAVLVNGFGALCCAGSEYDAAAVEMVLDKGCRAELSARPVGAKPIAPAECALMRYIYLKKYSKLAK